MFFGRQIHSLANPIQGSAAFDFGTKPADAFVTFSVGTQASPADEYVVRDDDGDLPTATIENSVLTFSVPQTHSYVGVGDVVSFASGPDVYLNKKISARRWHVKLADGGSVNDVAAPVEVQSIDKPFSDMKAAIGGASSGIASLLGTEDLVAAGLILRIACYEMDDTQSVTSVDSDWTTDENHFVFITVPFDIRHDCNSRQRHESDFAANGYRMSPTAAAIEIEAPYTVIDGVKFLGTTDTAINIIAGADGFKVINCMFTFFTTCVANIGTGVTGHVIAGNIMWDIAGDGIRQSYDGACSIYGNTIVDCTGQCIDIPGSTTSMRVVNCILQDGSNDFTGDVTALENCITSDTSSSGGTNCQQSISLKFMDKAFGDLRLHPDDFEAYEATTSSDRAQDLSADADYAFTKDNYGNPIDDTWCHGALHYVPTMKASIGPTTDYKSGTPNATITNAVITFNVPQTDSRVCSGCLVLIALTPYLLWKKIDDSNWIVTTTQGRRPSNVGSTAVTAITNPITDMHDAIEDDGGGTSFIETALGTSDLVTDDTTVELYPNDGADSTSAVMDSFTTDQTRFIKIRTANEPGVDCNANRRFEGVWNASLYRMDGALPITVTCDYTAIEGVQFEPDTNAIKVTGGKNITIDGNIIRDAGEHAILWDSPGPAERNVIVNNLIYDGVEHGIDIVHNFSSSNRTNSYFYIYQNTIFNCLRGVFFETLVGEPRTNVGILINNIVQECSEGGFECTSHNPETLYAEANFSDDETASNFFGPNNVGDTTFHFRNVAHYDFRLTLSDSIRMANVAVLSADPDYQVIVDFEGQFRASGIKWDAGCDNYSSPSQNTANFSIGTSYDTDLGGSGLSITIENSILTFSGGTIDTRIGVGDRVEYDTSKYAYLAEKGSDNVWRVVDPGGAPITDESTPVSVDKIRRVFDMLVDAIDGTATSTGLYTELDQLTGTGWDDLVTKDIDVLLWCYADGDDDGNVAISGWTTDTDHRITILSPWDTETQAITRQRHEGVWGQGCLVQAASTGTVIDVNNSWVTIEGMQIRPYDSSYTGVLVRGSAEGAVVRGNLFKDADTAIEQEVVGTVDAHCIVNVVWDSVTGIKWDQGTVYNNTVVDTTSIGIDASSSCYVKNNISQKASGNDFTGTATLYLCISSDATAGTSNGCRSNVTLSFADKSSDDFHLHRSDWEALNHGLDLSADVYYFFNRDIDMIFMAGEWSIGADSQPRLEVVDIFLSAGKNTSDFKKGIFPIVTIASGIAVFSADQDEDNMGVGDEVDYDTDNKKCYLIRKVGEDKCQWEVGTEFGLPPGDVSGVVLNSITHAFNDIATAVGTGAGSISELIGDSNNPFFALDTAKVRLNIAMYRDTTPHANQALIDFYEVNENCYVRIYTPIDFRVDCNKYQRHAGINSTGNEVFLQKSGTGSECIRSNVDYTRIEGLVLNGNSKLNHGVVWNQVTGCVVKDCLILQCVNGAYTIAGGGDENFCVNNVLWAHGSNAIYPAGQDTILNCTIDECTGNGILNSATDRVENVIAKDCSGGCFADNTNIEYCNSDDVTAGTANHCINFSDTPFAAEGYRDYRLAQTATDARGTGKVLSGDLVFPFSYDATGIVARGRFWDRGALEFVVNDKVYYAVGRNTNPATNNLKTPVTGTLSYSILIEPETAKSKIVFSQAQTNEGFGAGCEVKDSSSPFTNGCLLQERISDTEWYVTAYTGAYYSTPKSGTVSWIGRVFGTLSAAMSPSYGVFSSSYVGSTNLIANSVQVHIACYDDSSPWGIDPVPVEIPELITDPDFYLRIFAPRDKERYCVKNQRHVGKFGSGYRLDTSFYLGDIGNFCLKATAADFLEVEGIAMRNMRTSGAGMVLDGCKSILLENNIVAQCDGDAVTHEMQAEAVDVMVNNLVYGDGEAGISFGAEVTADQAIAYVYNNTVVGRMIGIHFRHAASGNVPTALLKNDIVQDSLYQDYVEDNYTFTGKLEALNCIGSDASVGYLSGSANQPHVNLEFADPGSGNYNLNSTTDFEAIDNGLDLSSDPVFPFTYDIARRTRDSGLWDIGAFEIVNVICFGADLDVGPLELLYNAATAGTDARAQILYLRENPWPHISGEFQFDNIGPGTSDPDDINKWLSENEPVDNLIIYVQSGKTFEGTLQLQDRTPRTVLIATDPAEVADGPASLVYPVNAPMIDNASEQALLTFENIKVYSAPASTQESIVGTGTTAIRLVNAILQCNYNSVVGSVNCLVDAVNSTIIFWNTNSDTVMRLVENSQSGNAIANSTLLVNGSGAIQFETTNASLRDNANNVLMYNYGSGTFQFTSSQLSKAFESLPDTDPRYLEMDTTWTTIAELMENTFVPRIDSPMVDAGDNSFVTDVPTDILGNARIFDFWTVDIGPYELEVHKVTFTPKNIQSIFQDKLNLNISDHTYVPASRNTVYYDLYSQFVDNPEHRTEFVRESKIIIQLKSFTQDYRVFTDKIDTEVAVFEAYYDSGSRSIVMDKPRMLHGNMLSTMFDDGRFVFRFNEVEHTVTVYLNTTYDKGLSGMRNVVNKSRFGGTSVVSG